jgi:hypothetical protein
MAARIRELTQPLKDRKAAGYAKNRLRCASAMQVAALCGKFAGKFFCDERGFRLADAAEGALRPVARSNGASYQMERCALQAGRGS